MISLDLMKLSEVRIAGDQSTYVQSFKSENDVLEINK